MREALSHIADRYTDPQWWYFNADSIALAGLVTVITAILWPPVHELSKAITSWLVTRYKP